MIIVALIITGTYKQYKNLKFNPSWTNEVKEISQFVTPDQPLYTDILTIKGLEFFWRYPENMNIINFEQIKSSEEIMPGSLVMVNHAYLSWLKKMAGWFPTQSKEFRQLDFYEEPPINWEIIWHNDNAQLYNVKD